MDINFNIFGSKNSVDTDIMVSIPKIGTIQESKLLVKDLEKELNKLLNIDDSNVNLCVISDGIVTEVYKGTPDEVNNSLYETYRFHNNNIGLLFVDRKVKRDKLLKVFRMSRIILSFLSRTKYRPKVKKLLKNSSLQNQLDFLQTLDFTQIVKIHPKYSDIEVVKTLFFQLGQTLHLLLDNEIYSKESLIEVSNAIIRDGLSRKEISKCKLNWAFHLLLGKIIIELSKNIDYLKLQELKEKDYVKL